MKKLPELELEVMQAIWQNESPVQRSDIEKILYEYHPIAQTTLLTILTRLSEKGFIQIEKVGRRSQYISLISKEEYLGSLSHNFFNKICNRNVSIFANALTQSGMSKEELQLLKELLEKE